MPRAPCWLWQVTKLGGEFKEAAPSRAEAAVASYLDAELSADEVDMTVWNRWTNRWDEVSEEDVPDSH